MGPVITPGFLLCWNMGGAARATSGEESKRVNLRAGSSL